jgi:hypothetical protein
VQIFTKQTRIPFMDPNSREALLRRREAGTLTWRGPALMLFARAAIAVGAQAVVAAVFALRASPTPWRDAEPWLPVYGTLIDAGCLALLWRLTRREGIGLFDLVGFERAKSWLVGLMAFDVLWVGGNGLTIVYCPPPCGSLPFFADALHVGNLILAPLATYFAYRAIRRISGPSSWLVMVGNIIIMGALVIAIIAVLTSLASA